jgi:hypothetical protein
MGFGLTPRRQDAKALFRETIDHSLDAVFHQIRPKVQHKTQLESLAIVS